MIFFLVMAFPFLEIWAFIEVADRVGGLRAFAWIAADVVVGLAIAQAKGREALMRTQQALQQGRLDEVGLNADVLGAVGGLLIAIPGFATDALGALLLLPGTRTLAAWFARRWLARQAASGRFRGGIRVFGAGGLGRAGGGHRAGAGADQDAMFDAGARDFTPPSQQVIDVSPVSSETRLEADSRDDRP